MKINRPVTLSISLCLALVMVGTPFVQAAQSTTGASAANNNAMTPEVKAKLQQSEAKQQALNHEQVTASVAQNYKKLKASGKIPVVSGPITFTTAAPSRSTMLSASSSSGPIYPYPIMRIDNNQGCGTWGPAGTLIQQAYHADSCWYQNKAYAGPGGYGGANAWAWVGGTFIWGGTSGYHNIITTGYESGVTTGVALGGATSEVDVVVVDDSNGASDSRQLHYASCSNYQYDIDYNNINQMMGEYLQNGHAYTVYVKISGSASIWGAGEGNSDYDWNNGGIWLYGVSIQ